MEAKHTPGPWEASIQRSKDGRDLGWIVEHVNGRIGWASLAYAHTNKEADEADPAREANARLIAAAPELLEALKAVTSTEMFLPDHPQRQASYKAARAAIAKATQ